MINPKDELRKEFDRLMANIPDDKLEALSFAGGTVEIYVEKAAQYVSTGAVRKGYTDVERAELRLLLHIPIRYVVVT